MEKLKVCLLLVGIIKKAEAGELALKWIFFGGDAWCCIAVAFPHQPDVAQALLDLLET